MKVLVVDDIKESVKGILDSCEENGWESKLVDFDDSSDALLDFDPDVVILDWREDAERIDTGKNILDRIWDITFRPVVIFSANADIIDISSKLQMSNMLKIIRKGDETPVVDFLKGIERFVLSLSSYRKDMSNALIESLNSIDNLKNETEIEDSAVGYILSKRTSAFFDNKYISELSPSWVQYLCPPLGSCLNVCDIIRIKTETINIAGAPEQYYIILTPSCDLYHGEGRVAKVSHVLCARCFGKELFHGIKLTESPSSGKIKSTMSKLNMGYSENYIALPGFSDIIPYMTADLKKVELIALNKIAANEKDISSDTEYVRIASICSPFREQIVWAHLQNSCRPGVPDRNTEYWAKEILKL